MRYYIFLLLTFFFNTAFAQLDTAKFQYIGFGDWYTLSVDRSLTGAHLIQNNYYADDMRNLGLTQMVAYADNAISLFQPIGIIDKSIQRFQTDTSFLPFVYAISSGNDVGHLPYQTGGPIVNDLTLETGFGFGDIDNTSLWVLPPNFFTTGDQNKEDTKNGETIYTYYADADEGHTPGLALILAETHNYHQPYDRAGNYYFRDTNKIYYYRISLNMKIDSAAVANDTIAEVIVWEILDPDDAFSEGIADTNSYLFPITGDRFTPGEYVDVVTDSFRLFDGTDSHIRMALRWRGEFPLWVDYFNVYDQYYEELVMLEDAQAESLIVDLLQQYLPDTEQPGYSHIYFDEPMITSNRSIGRVSELAEEHLGTYICGGLVPWGYDEYGLINSMRRPRYVMTHDYPIYNYTDSASTGLENDLQSALDFMIDRTSVTIVSPDIRAYPRKQGLRSHIAFAQGFATGQNHIPFYYTIQCQADYAGVMGAITEWRRAPAPNEIFVQGWLAICYGAKGFMFYNIHTDANTNEPPAGSVVNCVYGLYDEAGNAYDPLNPQTRWQDQNNPQLPNKRFYAVKSLVEEISEIDSVLTGLAYDKGYSIHKERTVLAADGREIVDVSTYSNYPNGKDLDTLTFVEAGFLQPYQPVGNEVYTVIVNRRCLANERRDILITFAGPPQGYANWLITDIAGDTSFYTPDSQKVLITIEPGRGTLLRIQPGEISGLKENTQPAKYRLAQNYPNPFNPSTTIEFSIPETANVTLKVYDMLGREVALLVNERKTAGNYTVTFDAGDLASGLYIYTLQSSNFIQTKKMLLLR